MPINRIGVAVATDYEDEFKNAVPRFLYKEVSSKASVTHLLRHCTNNARFQPIEADAPRENWGGSEALAYFQD